MRDITEAEHNELVGYLNKVLLIALDSGYTAQNNYKGNKELLRIDETLTDLLVNHDMVQDKI